MDAADHGSFCFMLCHEYCMKAVADPNYPRCNKFWRVYDRWIMWIGIILSFFGFWCTLTLGLGFTTIKSTTGCCGIFIDATHEYNELIGGGIITNRSWVSLKDTSTNSSSTFINNINSMVVEEQCSIEALSEKKGSLGYELINGNTMCTMDNILCNQFYTQDLHWRLEIDTYSVRRRRLQNGTFPSSLDIDPDDGYFLSRGYYKINWDDIVDFYISDRYNNEYNKTDNNHTFKCNSAFFESQTGSVLGALWFMGILVLFHMLNEWILSVCQCQKEIDGYCKCCGEGKICDPERIKNIESNLAFCSCVCTCFCCGKCWGNPMKDEGKKKIARGKSYAMTAWIMILWLFSMAWSFQIDLALETGYFTSAGYFDIYDNDTIIFDASGFEKLKSISELFSVISILSVIMSVVGCILAYCPCIKRHKYINIDKEEDVELMKKYEIECSKQAEMDPNGNCGYKGLCPCFFEKESKCYAPFGCKEKCPCCFDDDDGDDTDNRVNEQKVVELVVNAETKKPEDQDENDKSQQDEATKTIETNNETDDKDKDPENGELDDDKTKGTESNQDPR